MSSFSRKKIIRLTLGVVVGSISLAAIAVGYTYFAMMQTANQFMQSIFQEDIQKAYTFIAPDVQQKIPYESFEKSVKAAYSNNAPDIRIQWEKQKIRYQGAYMSGVYTTTNDVIVQIEIELRRQLFDWKVSYFKSR